MKRTLQLGLAAASLAVMLSLSAGFAGETGVKPQPAQAQQPQQQPQNTISPAEAFTIMAGEAEKGNPAAMLTLGTMYERGVGTPRNFVKSLEWYRKAANAGLAEGYYNVGVGFEIGMGTTGNPVEAFHNFEKSAELGLPQGLYKLASLYFTGVGTAKNEAWGIELLKRAADAGHMAAANDLGVIYFEGTFGQAKDVKKAFEMFTRAADLGNPEAMKNLAVFYRDGLGRPADHAQELKWYMLARRAGFPPAALDAAIEKLKGSLTPDQVKKTEADVDAWVAAFQKKQQEAAAAAQQQQKK